MNESEAMKLLLAASSFDNRTIIETDPAVWVEALHGLHLDECRAAVVKHYAGSSERLKPVHVRALVASARGQQVARNNYDPAAVPDADPDDVPAYLEALRAGRMRTPEGRIFFTRRAA